MQPVDSLSKMIGNVRAGREIDSTLIQYCAIQRSNIEVNEKIKSKRVRSISIMFDVPGFHTRQCK